MGCPWAATPCDTSHQQLERPVQAGTGQQRPAEASSGQSGPGEPSRGSNSPGPALRCCVTAGALPAAAQPCGRSGEDVGRVERRQPSSAFGAFAPPTPIHARHAHAHRESASSSLVEPCQERHPILAIQRPPNGAAAGLFLPPLPPSPIAHCPSPCYIHTPLLRGSCHSNSNSHLLSFLPASSLSSPGSGPAATARYFGTLGFPSRVAETLSDVDSLTASSAGRRPQTSLLGRRCPRKPRQQHDCDCNQRASRLETSYTASSVL